MRSRSRAAWAVTVPRRRVDPDGAASVLVELSDGQAKHQVSLRITDARVIEILVSSPDGAEPLEFGPVWSTR